MKKLIILLTAILLMVCLAPALADEVTDVFLGVNGEIPDVVEERGSLDGDTYYRGTHNVSPDVSASIVIIRFPVYADSISQVSITFDAVNGSCFSNRNSHINITDDTLNNTIAGPFTVSTCGSGQTVHTWNGFVDNPSATEPMGIRVEAARRINYPCSDCYVRLKSVSVTYIELGTTETGGTVPDGLIRPFQQADEDPEWGVFESEDEDPQREFTVIGFSNTDEDFVLAAASGHVASVDPLSASACSLTLGNNCAFIVPSEINESANDYTYTICSSGFSCVFGTPYRVEIIDELNGVGFEYFVMNAPDYVTVGDEINAGCILGTAIRVTANSGPTPGTTKGVAILNAYDLTSTDSLELLPYLNVYGLAENACNVDPLFSACIGDGDLSDDTQWTQSGTVAFNDPGFTLGSGGRISQLLNLNTVQNSTLTVGGRIISFSGGTGNLRLQLGEEIQNFPVNNDTVLNQVTEYKIPLDLYAADTAGFYTTAVSAVGNFQVELLYACLTQSGTAPPSPSGSCYFANHSFDYGTTDWTTFGDVIVEQGAVILTDGSYVSQSVHLFPDESTPHTYDVSIHYQAVFSEPPFLLLDPVEYQMEYRYPAAGSWTSAGPVTTSTGEFGQFEPSFDFEVSSETNGEFSIRANITDADATFVGIRLYSACIHPPFPGQISYGGDYFFTFNCTYITPPASGSQQISDWTQYHWLNLKRFFDCDLMVLLRRVEQSMNKFFTTVLWVIRYWIALLFQFGDWASDTFFPYLTGHLSNIAYGQTTFITTNDSEQCGNLFCLFTSLFGTGGSIFDDLTGLLGSVFNDLANTIQTIFNTLASTIQSVFHDIASLLNTLVVTLGNLASQLIELILAPILNFILSILTAGVSLLLTIIIGVLTIAFSLIGFVFQFFNQLLGLVNVIVSAWNNATPTPIPGLPTCAIDPQSNGICIGLWMLENTIFSGTGALFIPLFIGYGSIMLILWAIGTFKKTLLETSSAL